MEDQEAEAALPCPPPPPEAEEDALGELDEPAEENTPLLEGEFPVYNPTMARAWVPLPRTGAAGADGKPSEAPEDNVVTAAAAKSWSDHILEGVTSIYQKPIEGGRQGGVVGFATGIGAGVLGFASHTIQGTVKGVERAVLGSGSVSAMPTPTDSCTQRLTRCGTLLVTSFRLLWRRGALSLPLVLIDSVEVMDDVVLIETKHYLRVAFRVRSAEVASQLVSNLLRAAEFTPAFGLEHARSAGEADRWSFDLEAEYARLGLGDGAWRLVENDAEGEWLSPTYPRRFAVPADVDDDALRQVAEHRSQRRIPAVTWRHQVSGATMSRSAQPLVGLRGAQSEADQALVAAIRGASDGVPPRTFFFIDARGSLAAAGNQAAGKGVEEVSRYPDSALLFCSIPNIHAVRRSAQALAAACHPSVAGDPRWLSQLEASGWLNMLSLLLSSALRCSELLESGHSMLVHCSDGWDRTSQLSSLVQLISDPHCRTLEGFAVLVRKEWCSFGHLFALRHGHAQRINQGHDDERSPVFLQWLDAVWQLQRQCPSAFEFDEWLLEELVAAAAECRFGDFWLDSEREREEQGVAQATRSVWARVLASGSRAGYVSRQYVSPPSAPPLLPIRCGIRDLRLWEAHVRRWDPIQ